MYMYHRSLNPRADLSHDKMRLKLLTLVSEEVRQGHRGRNHLITWGSRSVAVPTYFCFKTSVIVFIVTNKRCLTTVPFKTLAVSCHIRDLCQWVRHIAAHAQDFDGWWPFSLLTFP